MKHITKIGIGVLVLVVSVFLISIISLPQGIAPNTVGGNYQNITVRTRVNITHSMPQVLNVTVYEALNFSARNVTLVAGSTKKVRCNATVRSWEGFNDIQNVTARLYHTATSSQNGSLSNNSHYYNSSCTLNSGTGNYTGWYICDFDMFYYANNGTWICNVTIGNSYTSTNPNFTGSNFNTTEIYPFYALNVTEGIDYGNVVVEGFSNYIEANITNLGNMGINISVEGYGVTRNDGLAMTCSINGNISVAYEKFALNSSADYETEMTALSGNINGSIIPGLTMPKQNTSTQVINSTYWKLYIPPNPAGNCSGYVLFTAQAP